MIHSMTGFGRSSFQLVGMVFDVEVRSVNHRYLDARVRLPRLLAALEGEVRARVQGRFSRGKVDLSVTLPGGASPTPRLEIDLDAAREYLRVAEQLSQGERVAGTLDVGTLLALPGVARLAEPEVPPEALREALFDAVDAALEALDGMRVAEGGALERDLLERAARIEELAASLEERAGVVQEAVRERLQRRAEQLRQETGLLDEARLHQEVVIAADRLDVTEEIVRPAQPRAAVSPHRRGRRPGKARGKAARLPAPGVRTRGQHDRIEGLRRAHRLRDRGAEGRDRASSRAGPER